MLLVAKGTLQVCFVLTGERVLTIMEEMKMVKCRTMVMAALVPTLFSVSVPASAGLVFGTSARTQFDGFVATLGDTYESFDGFPGQTNLTTQVPGVTFRTTADGFGFGSFRPPVDLEVNVICSPANPFSSSCGSSETDHLIGGVRAGGITDGQSVYEIVFATGQLRAGLTRPMNTFALTRFFSGTTLLAEHQSTTGEEFVGFLTDALNPITRIEIDGLIHPNATGSIYQVGYSDDLYFGSVAENTGGGGSTPEPATWLLALPALLAMRRKLLT